MVMREMIQHKLVRSVGLTWVRLSSGAHCVELRLYWRTYRLTWGGAARA